MKKKTPEIKQKKAETRRRRKSIHSNLTPPSNVVAGGRNETATGAPPSSVALEPDLALPSALRGHPSILWDSFSTAAERMQGSEMRTQRAPS